VGDAAIEIHDAGLRAARHPATGGVPEPAPGFAWLDGDRVVTGRAAWAQSRLEPRAVHHRFWSELDTIALSPPFPRDLSSADLAHAQLSVLWDGLGPGVDRVALAVSGAWSERRLGLALSVARAAGMPVVALVDGAVAAGTAAPGADGRRVHVDVRLHETVVTELDVGDDVERGRVDAIPGAGTLAIRSAWARWAAGEFVQQTRFDPLDRADTEQALVLALDGVVARLRGAPRTTLTLEAGGRSRAADLGRVGLVAAAREWYERIATRFVAHVGGDRPRGLMSSTAAGLPGLAETVSEAGGIACDDLDGDAAVRGALAACRTAESESAPGPDDARGTVPFLTHLPRVRRTSASEAIDGP
jgi:hypothetical protein